MKQQSGAEGLAWPRRRASDLTRISPFRRLAYECLALVVCLPFLLVYLSHQTGLWHANAFVYDQWLTQREPITAPAVTQVLLDEPCSANGCAALPMRYREAMLLLARQQVRAVWLEVGALSEAEQTALREWLQAQDELRRLPIHLLAGDWLQADRDGIVRGLSGEQHPLWSARIGPEPSWAGGDWFGWAWAPVTPTNADLGYASLWLDHPGLALKGQTVVVGARFPPAAASPWLVRIGASTQALSRTDALVQTLSALERVQLVRSVDAWALWCWSALPLWALLLLVWRWPDALPAWVLGLSVLVLGLSWWALSRWGWWWPVVTPLTGLLLLQMFWIWRRGHALSQVFGHRLARIEKALAEVPQDLDPRGPWRSTEPGQWQRRSRMEVLDRTLERLEAHHQIQRRMQDQRERWLAFLSHDLRAPQSNILSLVELRESGVEGMSDERFYGSVRLQVDRTLELAEGFVDLLRAESDRLHVRPCSLQALLAEAVDHCWPQAQARQVRLLQGPTPDSDGSVMADAGLLTRALVNIVSNAVRHSTAGQAVTLCVAHDPILQQVVCAIRDEGEGMGEVQLSQMLQALDSHTWLRPRPGAGRGGKGHGLGLGLLVARTVVSRHGGELVAWSAPDQGSTFVVVLPAARPTRLIDPALGRGADFSRENPPAATRALAA